MNEWWLAIVSVHSGQACSQWWSCHWLSMNWWACTHAADDRLTRNYRSLSALFTLEKVKRAFSSFYRCCQLYIVCRRRRATLLGILRALFCCTCGDGWRAAVQQRAVMGVHLVSGVDVTRSMNNGHAFGGNSYLPTCLSCLLCAHHHTSCSEGKLYIW